MHLNASRLASSSDLHLPSFIGSRLSVLKNGSATALPRGFPGLDIDRAVPCESRRLWNAPLARDHPVAPELAVDAAVAVPALAQLELPDEEPFERLPLYPRVRLGPIQVVVALGFGDAEDLACLPDGAEFAPMRLDEPAPRAWP